MTPDATMLPRAYLRPWRWMYLKAQLSLWLDFLLDWKELA